MALRDWFRVSVIDETTTVEEAKSTAAPGPANVTRAGYEFGVPPSGLNEYTSGVGESTQTDRRSFLTQLYDSYLACPWAWAAVQAISKTITAGSLVFDFDSDDGEGDQEAPEKPAEVLACERLFRYTNPREDIRQLMRGVVSDLLVFGDAFIEIVWVAGVPAALFSLDAPSMFPLADQHGQVTGYVQLTDFQQKATFQPHEIIHISLDSPRSGIFGVPPTQAALLPITSWLFAAATLKETHRKGGPVNIHVDMPQGMAQPEVNRWVAQYQQRNIGPRNIGYPIITKGGATVRELQHRRIEEMLHTLDQKRDEILSTFGVPPAMAGVIESGNLGAGTGEAQRKAFLVNTCQPLASLVLEKLDFYLLRRGFGISGWHLKFQEVDMRDSQVIELIRDTRLRNGSWTLDKYRNEIGEPPVEGGDTAILVDRQNLVRWRDMDAFSKSLVAKNTKGTDVEMDDPGDTDTPVSLMKAPPPVLPPALAATAVPGQPVPAGTAPAAASPTRAGSAPVDPEEEPDPGQGAESATYLGRPGRAVREDWRVDYQRRLREALTTLPGDDDAA